jgi:hypothetical protein
MSYQIAYGAETESIEDPDQLVLLTLPDHCADMDTDDLSAFIEANWTESWGQSLVGVDDVVESLRLALSAHGIDPATGESIIATLTDAIDNNA